MDEKKKKLSSPPLLPPLPLPLSPPPYPTLSCTRRRSATYNLLTAGGTWIDYVHHNIVPVDHDDHNNLMQNVVKAFRLPCAFLFANVDEVGLAPSQNATISYSYVIKKRDTHR